MDTGLPPDPAPPQPPMVTIDVAPVVVAPAITPTAPEVPSYRDRSTGLVIFGVFQIILGLLSALMVPLMVLGSVISRKATGGTMRIGQLVAGGSSYVLIAAALLVLGIGSVQFKRWARALTVVMSWYWTITGVLVTILMTAVLPVTMKTALRMQHSASGDSGDMSTGIMAVIITFVIVTFAFFLVVVPIAFLIFYSRKDVEQTCYDRDPVERWTDRTPLPVLGASVILFVASIYLVLIGLSVPIFPFFGHYLVGIRGAAGFLVLAAVDIVLATALFRRNAMAWWILICILPVRLISMAITYGRADLAEAYSKAGWSDAELKMLNASPIFHSHVVLWWSLFSAVIFFGYLIWLGRYFRTPRPAPAPPLPEAAV